jgi:L-alanine-DL-glutamate epimerase-like enolase superfamily enzyme
MEVLCDALPGASRRRGQTVVGQWNGQPFWAPEDLFVERPRCVDGHFPVPDRPGHGLELAPGAEQKYRAS